jgi:hypothetical protein
MFGFPDFFKVGISESGNHDNSIYNRWWSEKHDGVKEVTGEDGKVTFQYDIDKNQDIAGNLKGHLLLMTGDVDNNVHPSNTYRVMDALIRANKRFDFILLPGQPHSYGPMGDYVYWRRIDYFSEHLLGCRAERRRHRGTGSGAADQAIGRRAEPGRIRGRLGAGTAPERSGRAGAVALRTRHSARPRDHRARRRDPGRRVVVGPLGRRVDDT